MGPIEKVVILGANGTMGSGASALFAARGYDVAMLARTRDKAEAGLADAKRAVRADAIAERITLGTYEADLERSVAEADLVLECVAERLDLKQQFFERIDRARKPGSVVATVSSGLSMAAMSAGRSDDFRSHFMGIHLFNPPNVIVGTEIIPGPDTDRELFHTVESLLRRSLGRVVVVCRDLPAFAGNRVGFKVLNECAQLAHTHGVARIDYLVGPYTGRAMPPLATIDLVGWDVHRAIVDNVYALTDDEAHEAFALPTYMQSLIADGHLGNKTPAKGGFYRTERTPDGGSVGSVLDPSSGSYKPARPVEPLGWIEQIKGLHRVGRYGDAAPLFLNAEGPGAEIARRVILGYVSYGLNRVGPDEVVDSPLGVDLIMGYGFNWAPPSVLVDLFGRDATIEALQRLDLPVPRVVTELETGAKLFRHRQTNIGRYFINK